MDVNLYDEFGNYIGPDLESEDEDEEDQDNYAQSEAQPDYNVSFKILLRCFTFVLFLFVKLRDRICSTS